MDYSYLSQVLAVSVVANIFMAWLVWAGGKKYDTYRNYMTDQLKGIYESMKSLKDQRDDYADKSLGMLRFLDKTLAESRKQGVKFGMDFFEDFPYLEELKEENDRRLREWAAEEWAQQFNTLPIVEPDQKETS